MNKFQYKILMLVVGTVLSSFIQAQPYGNEWINLDQSYYRFSIFQSGMYRITGQQLQQMGIPLGSFNPANVQLFYKGQEIPCYIEGENSGLIEYIEFYAEKNDGWFDLDMWESPSSQGNSNYSLINDTASVFFTWNNNYDNLRYNWIDDDNYSGYNPASYCLATVRNDYTAKYQNFYDDSEYIKGEGYCDSDVLTLGGTKTKSLNTPGFVNNNIKTSYDIGFLTASHGPHNIHITGPGLLLDTAFQDYTTILQRAEVDVNTMTDETELVFESIVDENSGAKSRVHVTYISLTYPRNFNVNKSQYFRFTIPASANSKTYIELSNFTYDGDPLLYDLTNGLKIKLSEDNNLLKALIPASSAPTDLLLVDENYLFSVYKSNLVNFTDYSQGNNEKLILSHPLLWNEAQSYATYRNAYLINIEKLYDQFGYGIHKHPMAIRNFLNYIINTWTITPKSLFIIGKGIYADNSNLNGYRSNPINYYNCLIPPMGYQGSDVLLGNGIGNTQFESAIAIGRLAAQTPDDVSAYLDKVIEFEQNTPSEWMKQAIHFGGGNTESEQSYFESYLRSFEQHFEDSLFGGYVSTFLKTSSDPIETSSSDSVKNLINTGVSLMTFFGHGFTGGFDQNIDEPSNYNNQGKYPLMIANSCYSGDMFTPYTQSTSELWTLIPNRGTIAYFAMVGSGYPAYLNTFTNKFYQILSRDLYGKTLGEIIKQTRIEFQNALYGNRTTKSTIQQFTLHGDPSIVLNSFEKPDLSIDPDDIFFTPSVITTEMDSFLVNMVVTNIARSVSNKFTVSLTRNFQDGSETFHTTEINTLNFKDTLAIKLPTNKKIGQGLNLFTVLIDFYSEIDEMAENNNSASTQLYISSTDVFPVIPYTYSIYPSNNSVLKAATGDLFVSNQSSIFQLDTTYTFNSPFLISEEIIHDGGVIDWNTNLAFESDVTYFWRTAKKTTNDDEEKWSTSSFSYEPETNGWQQHNFGQIISNTSQFITANEEEQLFEFSTTPKKLRFTNFGVNSDEFDRSYIGYSIDGQGDAAACGSGHAMHVVVIDTTNFLPWRSDYADFGHSNYPQCNRLANYFVFHVSASTDTITQQAMDNLVAMINGLENGYYILVYSMVAGDYSLWNNSHFTAFESWGASLPRNMFNNDPYVMFMKKGYPEQTQEWTSTSEGKINDEVELINNFSYGSIESPVIGPSLGWDSFEWNSYKLEDNPEEEAFVDIIAITNTNQEVIIEDSITSNSIDLSTLNSDSYPYLKLRFFTRDNSYKTPAQLDFWKVIYTPVSDAAINPEKGWEFYNDTIQEGDVGTLSVAFENIGTTKMDSLLVKYWLQNSENEESILGEKRIKALESNESVADSISFETRGIAGNNSIWIELNPESNGNGYDQPEQYHFNNLLQKGFFVAKDLSNPILDVTFDGVHIMNDDLVSAKPEIVIQLSDENEFIALNDTSVISFYLKDVSGVEQKIPVTNNPEVTFIEAQLPENKAKIIFNHDFIEDGTYELRARGKDVSGNESGAFDYVISFRVINESTITHVFNYPNPFSSSTRFVFELTGSEIPDEMRIDILTVTGKLVKVIYLTDLGNISIGKNISDYAWDGTDMYGDALANGVYFYRVYSKLNGEEIKNRDTGTNQFFKNGFGKMYLIR